MPCSLLLLQGLWLWARLCMQSDSRQHQEKAEAGSQLGAICLMESLHPNRPLAKPWKEVPRALLPPRLSLGASGYPSGAPVYTHTGAQGQCCSGALLAEFWS